MDGLLGPNSIMVIYMESLGSLSFEDFNCLLNATKCLCAFVENP